MANKAVLGTAAFAAVLYKASEYAKEERCIREEEEERQRRADVLEQIHRRENEERQYRAKKGHGSGRGGRGGRGGAAGGECGGGRAAAEQAFTSAARAKCRDLLVEFVEDVRRRAENEDRRGSSSSSSRLGPALSLPLLDADRNAPGEIALGAALALGDERVVEEVLGAAVVKPTPEMALARLAPTSVELIKGALRDAHLDAMGVEHSGRAVRLSNLSEESIKVLLTMTMFSEDISRPIMRKLSIEKARFREELLELRYAAKAIGLFLIPGACFSIKPSRNGKVDYILKNRKQVGCRDMSAVAYFEDDIYLSNFCSSFYVPDYCVTWNNSSCSWTLQEIVPFGKNQTITSQTNDEKETTCMILARFLASRTADGALKRIETASRRKESISLEHVAVMAGFEGDVLADLRNDTSSVYSQNREEIRATLSKRLARCVPRPGCDWDKYWSQANDDIDNLDEDCGFSDDASAARSHEKLRAEVSAFVKNYIRLLDLSYCAVPSFRGAPPSAYVPESSVKDDAMSFMFLCENFGQARVARMLELGERERLIKSRELAGPSNYAIWSCIVSLMLVFSWLSYEAAVNLLACVPFNMFTLSSAVRKLLSLGMSPLMALWILTSFLELLKGPLHVQEKGGEGRFSNIWTTASDLSEVCARRLSVWRGLGTPFEREVAELSRRCRAIHRVWSLRCSHRDFYRALHRKKICSADLNLLLKNMAEENGGYLEGTLPGNLSDGDAFLRLEIETSDALVAKRQNSDSFDGVFSDISKQVNAKLQKFPPGSRIFVAMDFGPYDGKLNNIVDECALAIRASQEGTVISSYQEVVLVDLDGMMGLIPVPSCFCHLIEDGHESDDGFSENDDDESQTEECYNEKEEERREMERAKKRRARKKQLQLERRENAAKRNRNTQGKRSGTLSEFASKATSQASGSEFLGEPELVPEPQDSHTDAHLKPRHRTVRDALKAGGWKIARKKKHLVYKRKIGLGRQTFTMASTPSDRRGGRNALATLRQLDLEAEVDRMGQAMPPQSISPNKDERCCILCYTMKNKTDFSATQWKKDPKSSKCKDCTTCEQEIHQRAR